MKLPGLFKEPIIPAEVRNQLKSELQNTKLGYELSNHSTVYKEPFNGADITMFSTKAKRGYTRVFFNLETGKITENIGASKRKLVKQVKEFVQNLMNDKNKVPVNEYPSYKSVET